MPVSCEPFPLGLHATTASQCSAVSGTTSSLGSPEIPCRVLEKLCKNGFLIHGPVLRTLRAKIVGHFP